MIMQAVLEALTQPSGHVGMSYQHTLRQISWLAGEISSLMSTKTSSCRGLGAAWEVASKVAKRGSATWKYRMFAVAEKFYEDDRGSLFIVGTVVS